jgi:hypothetical protein
LVAAEHGVDLGLQRCGVERLDDVVVHAGLLGGDHVIGLRFGRDHDEGRQRQPVIGANLAQQLVARHRLHVPIRDHEAILLQPHHIERRAAVPGLVDIGKAKLLQ